MLDLKACLRDFDRFSHGMALRNVEEEQLLSLRTRLQERTQLLQHIERSRGRRKDLNQHIRQLVQSDPQKFEEQRKALQADATDCRHKETRLKAVEAEIHHQMLQLPNLPHAHVVDIGAQNRPVRTVGSPVPIPSPAQHHAEICRQNRWLDFARAAKISGSRFVFYRGALARLERALIQWMLEEHRKRGYEELLPPYITHEAALVGTGQLPKFAADIFTSRTHDRGHPYFFIPTAEVPLTNYHAQEIISEPLPLRYCAFSPCFRAEAGAAGKDTRGLIRLHQFHKVELVSFCSPDQADAELERLTEDARHLLSQLELQHRVVLLSAQDMGFAATKTYDLEVWFPHDRQFREISSCSLFGEFQARRASIRFREKPGTKPRFVSTLNGSALAVGRTVAALIEQHQQADGAVRLPKVLHAYMGTDILAPCAKPRDGVA